MNIDWVIPCRFAEVHDNLGTIIGAGIDTYWLPELPARVQVGLVVRLLAMVEELDPSVPRTITNRIFDPDGELIDEGSLQLAIGGQSARPEWLAGITLPFTAIFEASSEGTHTIETTIDDATKSLPIHIVHGLPPVAVPPASAE